ncbi:MAG: 50S ribosomal protein L10 [Prochloraceae cyanobacterium]|nr:50S ribosomal protein L10 [Prochloraceae cyanobacterium]
MGRTRANKLEVINDLKQSLSEAQLVVAIDYHGLSVQEISDLRDRLREKDSVCKVTKNTFMRLAVEEDENWRPMTQFLAGSSAFILIKDDIGGAIKAYQAFQKDTKKTEFRGGVMQGQALSEEQVKALADLPSKEELMAQIAGSIKSIPTKLAVGVKEVPSSVCRGINEVPASFARVIAALEAKKKEQEAA